MTALPAVGDLFGSYSFVLVPRDQLAKVPLDVEKEAGALTGLCTIDLLS
jgi:hypothetical protein